MLLFEEMDEFSAVFYDLVYYFLDFGHVEKEHCLHRFNILVHHPNQVYLKACFTLKVISFGQTLFKFVECGLNDIGLEVFPQLRHHQANL